MVTWFYTGMRDKDGKSICIQYRPGLFLPMVAWPWNCGTQGNRAGCALLISNSQLICSHFVEFATGSLGSMGFVSFLDFIYKYMLHWLYPRPQCISFCLLQPLEVHVAERPKVTTLSYSHNAKGGMLAADTVSWDGEALLLGIWAWTCDKTVKNSLWQFL